MASLILAHIIALFLALVIFAPQAVHAETKMVHVDLSYSGVAAGYRLYMDGVPVCTINDGAVTTFSCRIDLSPAPHTFVLTAIDVNGVESPQSAPYVQTWSGDPRIINLILR